MAAVVTLDVIGETTRTVPDRGSRARECSFSGTLKGEPQNGRVVGRLRDIEYGRPDLSLPTTMNALVPLQSLLAYHGS